LVLNKAAKAKKLSRELPGERDYARNNARCTQARKTTHSLDGQHQYVDGTQTPWKSQSEWQRIEINGESTFMVWPTLGSRMVKEQNGSTYRFKVQIREMSSQPTNIPRGLWWSLHFTYRNKFNIQRRFVAQNMFPIHHEVVFFFISII